MTGDPLVFEHHGHVISGAMPIQRSMVPQRIDVYVDHHYQATVYADSPHTIPIGPAFEVKALAALAAAGWTPDPDLDDRDDPFEDGTDRRERDMADDAAADAIGD